ncbi:hypothetical protein [Piscirickettsia salmonis]|uniref:hypothetical protein n=2 Tax=Piscirickettsia salmonis TaxID=1238 RepID=UPI0012BADF7B|nr:hypothetical protein [Piscirickettsia salmonis]QGP60435.1 hypothetical protein PsalBI1_03049 [Piscirickettsia salmonis]
MANKLTRFIVQEIRQLRDTIQNKQENERWRWPTTETKRSVRIWLLSEMEKELLKHDFNSPEDLEVFLNQWSDKIENFPAISPNSKGIGKGKTISNFFNLGKNGNVFSMLRAISAQEGVPFIAYTSLIDQIEQERKRKLQKKSTPFFNQTPVQEEHYLSLSDTRAHEA